jgi:hypothetical protein
VFAGDTRLVGELTETERTRLEHQLAGAYRLLFIVLAAISACGALIARNVPKPDWNSHAHERL